MKQAMGEILNWIQAYYANILYVAVLVASAGYLFACKKQRRNDIFAPLIVLALCLVNPVLYYVLLRHFAYWRLWWIIPDAILIAYAVTDVLSKCKKIWAEVALTAVFIGVLILTGMNVFKNGVFVKIQNPQKVSAQTKLLCDIILGRNENPSVIMPAGVINEARQYNGNIEMMYGRNADGYINVLDNAYDRVYQELNSAVPDYDYVFLMAFVHKYEFVVCGEDRPVDINILEKYGYSGEKIGGYIVYQNADIAERAFDGWVILRYNDEMGNAICYTMENDKGELVIAGEVPVEFEHEMRAIIRSHDNQVAKWVVSDNAAEQSAYRMLKGNSMGAKIPQEEIDKELYERLEESFTGGGSLVDAKYIETQLRYVK